jgi:predicted glycosyltransferase
MKILIDIGHPAHVHLFRFFAKEMQDKGHQVLFICRNKEVSLQLLEVFGFKYISFGNPFQTIYGKILGMFWFDLRMLWVCLKFQPNILLSNGSMYAAHTSFLLRRVHISFEDTGNMEQIRLYLPFSSVVLTSVVFHKRLGKKQIYYNGYHELAYLHPKYFKPEPAILKEINIKLHEKFFLIRLVSWKASHDIGQTGISRNVLWSIIKKLEKTGKIFISSEASLPEDLIKYTIKISPEKIHHILFYAHLIVTEGATMASECAMIGTPAVYVNSISAGSLEDQEKYGLIFGFRNVNGVLEKIDELLSIIDQKTKWSGRRDRMLADKIDVTAFLVWFVENYPESAAIMREDPDYQLRFR